MAATPEPQHRPNGHLFDTQHDHDHGGPEPLFPQLRVPPDYLPGGKKSLSGISFHAFGLGIVGGGAALLTAEMLFFDHFLWRLPFFVMTLAIFHYLEFDMTARYNPPDAKLSSFLLFSNGTAYNVAHTMAVIEVIFRYWLRSRNTVRQHGLPWNFPTAMTVLGLFLVVMGQLSRSLAMKKAGTSFNHLVQSTKKEDHVLVTEGIYSFSRHPAYFGFFWWGIGTQLCLGNHLCLVAYTAILWKFFSHRIYHEEKFLTNFFGQSYVSYRQATRVGIPFIA